MPAWNFGCTNPGLVPEEAADGGACMRGGKPNANCKRWWRMKPVSARHAREEARLRIAKARFAHHRRKPEGESWTYWSGHGRRISTKRVVLRLNKLAMPGL